MPEKQKEEKRKREIKDAGQRVVMAAVPMKAEQVAKLLATGHPGELDAAEREKIAKEYLSKLDTQNGEVQIWVKLGQVEANTREEAIDSVLGPEIPGSFRAPNASSWRGQINRKPPAQVALEVELVD